jgi:hypothetical protein
VGFFLISQGLAQLVHGTVRKSGGFMAQAFGGGWESLDRYLNIPSKGDNEENLKMCFPWLIVDPPLPSFFSFLLWQCYLNSGPPGC